MNKFKNARSVLEAQIERFVDVKKIYQLYILLERKDEQLIIWKVLNTHSISAIDKIFEQFDEVESKWIPATNEQRYEGYMRGDFSAKGYWSEPHSKYIPRFKERNF